MSGARLRPGNVHSADGILDFIIRLVERYRTWFKLFWLRGDAAFANPEIYEHCEDKRITYFIRLPGNRILMVLIEPHLNRPVGRPPENGIQLKIVDLHYQAKSWTRPRRVVVKIEWHRGELFHRIGFVVTNSRLPGGKVIKVYNGRAEIENRIKDREEHLALGQDQLPSLRSQPGPAEDGSSGLQSLAYDPPILRLGRGSSAVNGLAHQTPDQSRCQSLLPRPEVVCAYCRGLSPGSPLPGGAGLGFLDRHPVRICKPRSGIFKIYNKD